MSAPSGRHAGQLAPVDTWAGSWVWTGGATWAGWVFWVDPVEDEGVAEEADPCDPLVAGVDPAVLLLADVAVWPGRDLPT